MRFPLNLPSGALLAFAVACSAGEIIPLPLAHAHNDYEHAQPLLDALDAGFCSVEADVHLVDGQLLVAHDRSSVHPERTLEHLYLRPLQDRVRLHRGRVYPNGPGFTLLVDLKSDAEPTYAALKPLLQRYSDILTQFTATLTHTNAVTVILSGNRPTAIVSREPERWIAIDGRLSDLDGDLPSSVCPLISDNWALNFTWRGKDALATHERDKLWKLVHQAHEEGRRIRFWATPDSPAAWQELFDAGVDLINTDNLKGLAQFLRDTQNKRPRSDSFLWDAVRPERLDRP